MARLAFWDFHKKHVAKGRMKGQVVLTLCGDGGDSRCLRGLGFDHGTVVSADMDREILDGYADGEGFTDNVEHESDEDFDEYLKEIIGRHEAVFGGDAKDVAINIKAAGKEASMIFLDFCSPLLQRNVQTLLRCAQRCLAHDGRVAMGFMYGREQKSNLVGRTLPHLREGLKQDAAQARVTAAAMLMMREQKRYGLAFEYAGSIAYSSVTKDSKGVPMIYIFWKKVGRRRRRLKGKRLPKGSVVIPVGDPKARLFGSYEHLMNFMKDDALYQLHNGIPVDRVSLMYSIDRRTVIAWKAHLTRGTYQQEST